MSCTDSTTARGVVAALTGVATAVRGETAAARGETVAARGETLAAAVAAAAAAATGVEVAFGGGLLLNCAAETDAAAGEERTETAVLMGVLLAELLSDAGVEADETSFESCTVDWPLVNPGGAKLEPDACNMRL
jgi:hypothetical protein